MPNVTKIRELPCYRRFFFLILLLLFPSLVMVALTATVFLTRKNTAVKAAMKRLGK